MIDQLKPLLGKLALFSQERLGFKHPPKLFLRNDFQNSQQALGKTAFYNPEEQSVTLFIHGRHPKDILRSFTHELVHHCQNERGDLSPDKMTAQGPGYAQECPHMRKMEQEAYLEGSMCFRDWEDTIEDKDLILIKLAESKFLKENKQMTTKITKEFLKETIRKVLQEKNESELARTLRIFSFDRKGNPLSVEDPTRDRYDASGNKIEPEFYSRYGDEITKFQEPSRFDMEADSYMKNIGMLAGASSKLIKRLGSQQRRLLRAAGFKTMKQLQTKVGAKPTGEYDAQTYTAIKAFQKKIGTKDDGVFGKNTAKAAAADKLKGLPGMDQPAPSLAQIGAGAKLPGSLQPGADDSTKLAKPSPLPATKRTGVSSTSIAGEPELISINDLGPKKKKSNPSIATGVKEDIDLDESNCGSGKRKDGKPCGNRECKTCYPMEEGKLPDALQKYQDEQAEKKTDDSKSEEECSTCGGKKPDDGCPHCDGDAPRSECKCGHDDKDSEKSGDSKDGKMPMKKEPEGQDLNNDGKKGSGEVPAFLKEGSRIQTPEQENALYEQRFTSKNNRLFEKLVKEWTK